MKQVKFLNEADRPQIKAPYTFTQWCESKGYLHWASTIDDKAAEYAAYIASFPTEKKKVEFTHYLNHKGLWNNNPCDPQDAGDVVYLGKDNVEGDVFCVKTVDYVLIYKGHLNSSYY